jgi:hypothetical protein
MSKSFKSAFSLIDPYLRLELNRGLVTFPGLEYILVRSSDPLETFESYMLIFLSFESGFPTLVDPSPSLRSLR